MKLRRSSSQRKVTICFHGIGDPGRDLEAGEARFWISHRQFEEILTAISHHPSPVELTFDDGNASDFNVALPLLITLRLRATFFIITDRIDSPGSLSTAQLSAISGSGMLLGTHGASHRPWTELASEEALQEELTRSRQILQDVTGGPIESAAFPRGMYNRVVLRECHRLNFRRVYSVDEGSSHPSAWMRTRYTVIHSDTPQSVLERIDNPYQSTASAPVHTMKQLVKRLR